MPGPAGSSIIVKAAMADAAAGAGGDGADDGSWDQIDAPLLLAPPRVSYL